MDSSSLFISPLFSLLLFFLFLHLPTSQSLSFNTTTTYPPPPPTKCHQEERNALLEFKANFLIIESCIPNTDSGANLTTWTVEDNNGDCCNWSGVVCDQHTGHVIELDLGDSCLSGSINSSSSIFKLTHLQSLDLLENDFRYSTIPSAISNLSQLETLYLYHSNFSGQIPPEILNLTKLTTLVLSDLTLKNPSLRDLVQSLLDLELLYLGNVEISSSLPDSLFRSTSLRGLGLSGCKLQGQVPPSLANLTKLEDVDLSYNQFTGNFSLLKWSLQYVDLSFNQLKGSLPIPSTNSSLRYYVVSNNEFSGDLPMEICNFVNLEVFDISNNNLNGVIPQCLTDLVGRGNLSVLNLHNNNFNGPIPQVGKSQCNLMMIDMSNNQLEGPVPRDIENCIDLEFLNLGNNRIIDGFPFWLGELQNLSILILHSNRFYGIIEKPLGSNGFSKLQIINLSNNSFTGYLPNQYIEGWMAMKVDAYKQDRTVSYASDRKVDNSYFYTVTITDKGINVEYTKIPESLAGVDLSNNHFIGEIPKSITTLEGLRFLNLSKNMLTGSIPFNLSGLTNLESLDLSHNNLFGEIPQQLTDLTTLSFFDVSFNQLTGRIPQSKQFNTFENNSYLGNPGLCGPPLLKKCGEASPPPPSEKDHALKTWIEVDWKVVWMGYSSGFVIGVVMGINWTQGCKRVKKVRHVRFILN